jgi:hypothetical protein
MAVCVSQGGPRGSRWVPGGTRGSQVGSRWVPGGPRRSQGVPGGFQVGSRWVPGGPRRSQEVPGGPRRVQGGFRGFQEGFSRLRAFTCPFTPLYLLPPIYPHPPPFTFQFFPPLACLFSTFCP